MYIENDIKLDFKDVLIRPKRSTLRSRADVSLTKHYQFYHSSISWEGVPIIAANMDHVGTFEMAKALSTHRMMTALHKFYSLDQWQSFFKNAQESLPFHFISMGMRKEDVALVKSLNQVIDFPNICIDVANGYSESFVTFVSQVRELFPDKVIMAGNVVTGEMVEQLILSGADIVKVGIGPGSVCTTRKKTGVGYPQLSAIIECADAAHGLKGHICSDGGCVVSGDVAKAFAAGADFVMLGGIFAGHDECAGEVIERGGKKFKRFYGMSSQEAMNKHHGKVAEYRASEGKSVNVPYRGKVGHTVQDILGGLRSACTYAGAKTLKSLPRCTTFVRVTQQLNEIYTPFEV
jgi:GMP reductase